MDKINIILNRISKDYTNLKIQYKKELFNNYGIDSGTDYARMMLEEIVYNENGESLY